MMKIYDIFYSAKPNKQNLKFSSIVFIARPDAKCQKCFFSSLEERVKTFVRFFSNQTAKKPECERCSRIIVVHGKIERDICSEWIFKVNFAFGLKSKPCAI